MENLHERKQLYVVSMPFTTEQFKSPRKAHLVNRLLVRFTPHSISPLPFCNALQTQTS
jgi:hypothetical protein